MSLIIKAQTPVYGGYVIARDNGIIFTRGTIPGELVEVSIDEKKKDYSVASVINILEPSPFRINPPCPVSGICGGCQLQFISYARQVSMKEEILLDSLQRIGEIEIQLMPALTDRDYHYRHRGQFKVSSNGEPGFYKEGTREVVPIDECPLMVKEINYILKKIRGIYLSGIKEIHLIHGDTTVALVKGKLSSEEAEKTLSDMGVSGLCFENGESIGKDYIRLDLNGLQYTITPWSFFQSHWRLNIKVVNLVLNELSPLDGKNVLDLYAGAGNFSLPVAKYAGEVIAVEENTYAVEDGQRNARINGIKNCMFIKATAEKYRARGYCDIVVLDPPRPGLTSEIVRKVLEISPQKIVYISCNPSTLARDLKKLKEKYEIDSVRMIDFFPNTYHVESVAFLHLR